MLELTLNINLNLTAVVTATWEHVMIYSVKITLKKNHNEQNQIYS